VHFFNEKRKNQSIPFPWKVGEITVKNISHLNELTSHFDHFKLKEIPKIPGFDPSDVFTTHMSAISYGTLSVNTTQFKEGGGDNQNPMEAIPEKVHNYLDTLVRTND
jgi:hypothetical protein